MIYVTIKVYSLYKIHHPFMNNIENFDAVIELILADLHKSFPVPMDVCAIEYAKKAGVIPPEQDGIEYNELTYHDVAQDAIKWLISENFISTETLSTNPCSANSCVLTNKGFQYLHSQ